MVDGKEQEQEKERAASDHIQATIRYLSSMNRFIAPHWPLGTLVIVDWLGGCIGGG